MTCVVAVSDGKGTVVMGADSAASNGMDLYVRDDRKVFKTGHYLIGFTTSFRMGQILRYETELPDPPAGADAEELERFFVTGFVPAVRKAFQDHGFAKTASFPASGAPKVQESGQEVGGLFVIGVGGMIFEIREDFHLSRPSSPWSSIGTGAGTALGALHALAGEDIPARERAERALRASEAYCAVVRGPFHFETI